MRLETKQPPPPPSSRRFDGMPGPSLADPARAAGCGEVASSRSRAGSGSLESPASALYHAWAMPTGRAQPFAAVPDFETGNAAALDPDGSYSPAKLHIPDQRACSVRILKLLARRGLTQSAVAKAIGRGEASLCRWLSDAVPELLERAVLVRLAEALKTTVGYLVYGRMSGLLHSGRERLRALEDIRAECQATGDSEVEAQVLLLLAWVYHKLGDAATEPQERFDWFDQAADTYNVAQRICHELGGGAKPHFRVLIATAQARMEAVAPRGG